jgi:hypothetical protein
MQSTVALRQVAFFVQLPVADTFARSRFSISTGSETHPPPSQQASEKKASRKGGGWESHEILRPTLENPGIVHECCNSGLRTGLQSLPFEHLVPCNLQQRLCSSPTTPSHFPFRPLPSTGPPKLLSSQGLC